MTVAIRTRNGAPIETGYARPITVVKYIHDVVVVVTPFGAFILSPTSVAYADGEEYAVAEIQREGGRLRFKPRDAEKLKDIIRSYMPDSLPPQLQQRHNKIYLGDVEVGTVYELT